MSYSECIFNQINDELSNETDIYHSSNDNIDILSTNSIKDMSVTLHFNPISQPSRAALALLKIGGI